MITFSGKTTLNNVVIGQGLPPDPPPPGPITSGVMILGGSFAGGFTLITKQYESEPPTLTETASFSGPWASYPTISSGRPTINYNDNLVVVGDDHIVFLNKNITTVDIVDSIDQTGNSDWSTPASADTSEQFLAISCIGVQSSLFVYEGTSLSYQSPVGSGLLCKISNNENFIVHTRSQVLSSPDNWIFASVINTSTWATHVNLTKFGDEGTAPSALAWSSDNTKIFAFFHNYSEEALLVYDSTTGALLNTVPIATKAAEILCVGEYIMLIPHQQEPDIIILDSAYQEVHRIEDIGIVTSFNSASLNENNTQAIMFYSDYYESDVFQIIDCSSPTVTDWVAHARIKPTGVQNSLRGDFI